MNCWVSNTSPLIFLAKLEKLDILRQLVPTLIIPEYVFTEITAKSDSVAKIIQQACDEWIQIDQVTNQLSLNIALANIHQGEAEAIVLAQEKQAQRVLLDDQDARKFAIRCGLKVIGTLGILLAAKKQGFISSLKTEIDLLISMNFRITNKLLERILTEANE